MEVESYEAVVNIAMIVICIIVMLWIPVSCCIHTGALRRLTKIENELFNPRTKKELNEIFEAMDSDL